MTALALGGITRLSLLLKEPSCIAYSSHSMHFPAQLTPSRIGNLTRLILTLAICVTLHTYLHTRTFRRDDLSPPLLVTVSDPERSYCTGACLSDELPRAARIRAVSCWPVTPGGRTLVFQTQYNSIGHRARLSGANRHGRERLTTYIRDSNRYGIGAWRYWPR